MHVVVFRHTEENTDRVKFSIFEGLLLHSFLFNHFFFFSMSVFFREHSRITGLQGKEKAFL